MSDIFTHGQQIECPECPGTGKRQRKPVLEMLSKNYSGCSVDFGGCPECGKAWQVSYKIDNMTHEADWDIPSRKEREQAEEKEAARKLEQKELEEYKEFERLRVKFGAS